MDSEGRIKVGGIDITDKFVCLVCKNLPKSAIYQCRSGHIVCHECYGNPLLKICPYRCVLPPASQPIRNIVAQSILDEVIQLECPFKENGCGKRIYRNMIEVHVGGCHYNFQKFGNFVNLCNKLGYPSCTFKVNNGNTSVAIQHFQREHGFHFTQLEKFQMDLEYFKRAITLPTLRYWTPVIAKLPGSQSHLVILPVQTKTKEFSCVSIWFPDSSNYSPAVLQSPINVKYTVPQGDHSVSCKLTFAQTPMSITEGANLSIENLPLAIPGLVLKEHMRDEETMNIVCQIKGTSTVNVSQRSLKTFPCKADPPLPPKTKTLIVTKKARTWLKDEENKSNVNRESLSTFLLKLFEENPDGYTDEEIAYLKYEAFFLVLKQGVVAQLTYLLNKGCNFKGTSWESLLEKEKDKMIALDKIKTLVNFGVDFKESDPSGAGLLHYASRYGNAETVKYVVNELKLDVNAQDDKGRTPLHYAVENGDKASAMSITKVLLDHGADPGITTKDGNGLVKLAKQEYRRELKGILLWHDKVIADCELEDIFPIIC